jgi:pimeloyl-ACP methyl ester carboxylesterase
MIVPWQAHGRGPALVLINGFAASGRMWPRRWVRELERQFRVITLDNRGSGFSRHVDAPFSIAELADDVVAVMDDAEVGAGAVFGISMGGMIAQEVALRHPERVTSLVLAASRPPNPAFHPPSLRTRWLLVQPPPRGSSLADHFNRLWSYAAAPGFAEANPDAIAEITRQNLERPASRAMLINQSRAMSAWGHAERLATITTATLIVHGRLDRLSPVENGRQLAAAIPGARYVELEGVGHLLPQEIPGALTELLLEHCLPASGAMPATAPLRN